jgi:hypothetical protein
VNLHQIRADIAAACGGRGFNLFDYIPPAVELPAVIVGWPTRIGYNATLAGGCEVELPVTIAFSRVDDEHSQALLDDALSGALAAAIEATDSSAWVAINVPEAVDVRTLGAGSTEILAADLTVQIITT